MQDMPCPCGNNTTYQNCCQPIHQNHSLADHPEKLMRSRYSAHVLGLVDYIIQTYHPSCKAEKHRESIQQSIELTWRKLEVIQSEILSDQTTGFVEFKAYFEEAGQAQILHEKSRFLKEESGAEKLWFYIDGEYPKTVKLGRNDPCHCGSGKKFKKCCG